MENLLTPEHFYGVLRALVTLAVGLVAARLIRTAVGQVLDGRTSPTHVLFGRKLAYYLVLALAAVSALREIGVNLSVLLGAAGVVSVAMGFAAQTSASNLISGLFLMGERPFVVGEVIEVAGTTGEVLSIDLLSVKLSTADNLFVRVPNETLVKASITNLSRHPIRRYDMQLGIGYGEKIGRVREILMAVAEKNPLCLREPAPLILFQGFGDSSVDLQFSTWAATGNFIALRNTMAEEVKSAFDREGVEFPFPHRTVDLPAPLPIAIVSREGGPPAESQSS
jgi:small-conductance mechanosensitive channel